VAQITIFCIQFKNTIENRYSKIDTPNTHIYDRSFSNLFEIRIPKKFSVCIFILISFQGLSKVFWKFLIGSQCIPMDILAWTDCVRSSAGQISSIDIFLVQICKNIDIFLPFTASIR
jgi:hypothetical protein